jgi:4-amino-4-deoxy-L-arabinose transferase-like glycosyltransferase
MADATARRALSRTKPRPAPLRYLPLILVALAYLLRTFSLDWQSLWVDESQAFYFVDRPFMETARMLITPDNNGPLYYLLLWVWRRLAGPSDFALRYLSDLCSALTVAVVWRLARGWFGRRVAGWTGLLLAISPFAVWFGQEAKMYALHMLLAGLATLLLARALRRDRWPLWLAYGVSVNLVGYSHFYGGFTIAAHGLLTLLSSLVRWRTASEDRRSRTLRPLRSYIITMVLVVLPYLPVVSFALRILPNFNAQDISKGFVPLPAMLREMAAEYTLRTTILYVEHPGRLLWPLAALLILGLAEAWRRSWQQGLWLTGMLLLPTAIFYPISFKIPTFSPKYLSASFLFFVMTLALALEALRHLWRPLLGVGLATMVVVAGWANVRILTDPAFQRTDWRTAATYLEEHAWPDDAIVVFAHYIHRPLGRYYDGPAAVYPFHDKPYQPEDYYRDWLQTDNDHHALWLVLHQDQAMAPHNRMAEGAGLLYPQITGVYPNNGQIAILGYSLRWRHPALPARATPLEARGARFANGLALVGFEVDQTMLPPTDHRLHPPSNWIHVTTYWQAWDEPPPPEQFTPFVRMVDAQGGVWGGELQRPPTVFHFDPPAAWPSGTVVEAHYDVNLNPVTPPGTYRLIAGIEQAGARVERANGATDVHLTDVHITP